MLFALLKKVTLPVVINIEQALRLKFSLVLTPSKPDDKHYTPTGYTVQLTI